MKTYDFIALGGGSAGFNGARVAADLGRSVAIVDGAAELGGLCILRGCMPSKTLLYSADLLHRARQARRFGLKIPRAAADLPALHARKRRIIGEFAEHRVRQLTSGRYTLYRQAARFIDPHTLALADGTRLHGRRFLIATGSTVSPLPVPVAGGGVPWTSDDVLDLEFVPESVLVLGGGIVACELAQFLARIGARVTQVQRSPQLLRRHSPEAAAVLQQAFRAEGIEVLTDTRLEQLAYARGRWTLTFSHAGRRITRRAAHVLNALGRSPATPALNLAAAGVGVNRDGRVVVNRWQQTRQPHIYAGGDVCGPHDIVHLAVAQGELAARHAFGVKGLRPVDPALLLTVVFTEPQIATLGWSERDLQAAGTPYLRASYPFNDHGKSILMDALHGHVTVLAEPRRGRILGAEIVGPDAGELIHCLTGPLALRATVSDLLRAPWYHPTLAEIVTYPLEELAEQIR